MGRQQYIENHLVDAYLSSGQIQEASELNQDELRQSADNLDAHIELGRVLLAQGKIDDALLDLRQQVAAAPGLWQAHYLLGLANWRNGNFDQANGELEQALDIFANSPEIPHSLTELNLERGDLSIAEDYAKRALALPAEGVDEHLLLGNVYLREGKFQYARQQFARACDLAPDSAAGNLAWVYLKRDTNLNVALRLAEKAKQLMPDMDSISDTLAMVYYKKGLYSSAIPLFEECVQKAPLDPSYRYHLGLALVAMGDEPRARQELRAALKLNLPSDDAELARQTLETLR